MSEQLTAGFVEDSLRLRGRDIPVRIGLIPQNRLRFYPDNPRVYSALRCADDVEPGQEDIEKALQQMDHVNQLFQSIKANGGLTDPILVRDGDFVVLEGNSRLAAYRMLFRRDPVKWAMVKCQVLPADTGDKDVFALLGEYHIVGKKDWAPYEQAGYLWRRHKRHGVDALAIAKEVGIAPQEVKKLIEVYDFMVKSGDTASDRWSYYYEYLSHRPLQKARQQYPQFDAVVVGAIQSGAIPRAIDVREKLNVIAQAPKALRDYALGKKDLERALESAQSRGAGDACCSKLVKFRQWLVGDELSESLDEMAPEVRAKCYFELKKISNNAERLLQRARQRENDGGGEHRTTSTD